METYPGKTEMMELVNKDDQQLLCAYVPYAQETEENISMIRREMEYTKMDQQALLGIFLLLCSHNKRNYQKGNKKRKSVKEKDEQSLSELWVNIKQSNL